MSAAATKNPPAGAGLLDNSNVSNVCNSNIQHSKTDVKLPAWMLEKLAKIATKIDVYQFEQDEAIILAAGIRCYPKLAESLPADFREKIQKQKPRELDPAERAALVIAGCDWQKILDTFEGLPTETKIAAKINILALALREGGRV